MVCEIRLRGGNKGLAVEKFMQMAPFEKRLPVFIGDDVTDYDGFAAVNRMAGISIQIGRGSSHAQYYLDAPMHLRAWLNTFFVNINKEVKK